MGFPTAGEVKQSAADVLHVPAGEMEGWWDGICADAVESAIADVRGVLLQRGFLDADVQDMGGDLRVLTKDRALWHAFVRAGMLSAFDAKFLDLVAVGFEQLKAMRITDGAGNAVNPTGIIGHGRMQPADACGSTFLKPDPSRPGRFVHRGW